MAAGQPWRDPGAAKLIRTGVLTSFVTHAGPREREMLFVPEARNAEITGGYPRVPTLESHRPYTKWHDFLEAVLVTHRGRSETKWEGEETHFPTYVALRIRASLRHI